jgi:hypothetical protein
LEEIIGLLNWPTMNLTMIDTPPTDIRSYANLPADVDSEESIQQWLQAMLAQGVLNLHVNECFFSTVKDVYELAVKQNYRVLVKTTPGKTVCAEFWFERLGDV